MIKAFFISLVVALLVFAGLIYAQTKGHLKNLQTNLLDANGSSSDMLILGKDGEVLPLDSVLELGDEAGDTFDYSY